MLLKSKEDFSRAKKSIIGHWKVVVIATVAMGIIGASSVLVTGYRWESQVTLFPEFDDVPLWRLKTMSNFSIFGKYLLSQSKYSYNLSISEDICSSTSFLAQLLPYKLQHYVGKEIDSVTVYEYFNTPKILRLYGRISRDSKETSIIDVFSMTKSHMDVIECLKEVIRVRVDENSGTTTIDVVTDNPFVSKQLADMVSDLLKKEILKARKQILDAEMLNNEKSIVVAKEGLDKARQEYAEYMDKNRDAITMDVLTEQEMLSNEVTIAAQIYDERVSKKLDITMRAKNMTIYYKKEPAVLPTTPLISIWQLILDYMFVGITLTMGFYAFIEPKFKNSKK